MPYNLLSKQITYHEDSDQSEDGDELGGHFEGKRLEALLRVRS